MFVGEAPHPMIALDSFDRDLFSVAEVFYHADLLVEAGLLVQNSGFYTLTWSGQEFLASASSIGRFDEALAIASDVIDIPFSVFNSLLVDLAKQSVGLRS